MQRSSSATSNSGSPAHRQARTPFARRVSDSGDADQPTDADETCRQQHSDAEAVKVKLSAGAARTSDSDDRDSEQAGDRATALLTPEAIPLSPWRAPDITVEVSGATVRVKPAPKRSIAGSTSVR
jgi:hypothetical protein